MSFVAALLIALAVIGIFLLDRKIEDKQAFYILAASLVLLLVGAWIMFFNLSFEVIQRKAIGIVLTGIGFFLVVKFPSAQEQYHSNSPGFAPTGILIGLICLIAGLYMVLF